MSDLADKLFERALQEIKAHDYVKASATLTDCIRLNPSFVEAWVIRGNISHANSQPLEAILQYDRAIQLKDNAHDAWCNRGIAFCDLGMWEEARKSFITSLSICPTPQPHVGLANMYSTLNKLEDAEHHYGKAVELDSGNYEAQFNRGCCLLGLGRWKEGFPLYEARWHGMPYPPRARHAYKPWNGEDLKDKTILLYAEQGYGDEIMGLRFASYLEDHAKEVYVEVRTPIYRLAKMSGLKAFIKGDPLPEADFSCPLLDVPGVLGMQPSQVVFENQYLYCSQEQSDYFAEKLPKDKINIGICWSSGNHLGTAVASRQNKSIPVEMFDIFNKIKNAQLVSLQVPKEPIPRHMNVLDFTDELHDFADTAALIKACDSVISVDTSVAHLAGALGERVYNLVRFSGYWPWLAPETLTPWVMHSIWYPRMKLYRQKSLGDWRTPIAELSKHLEEVL